MAKVVLFNGRNMIFPLARFNLRNIFISSRLNENIDDIINKKGSEVFVDEFVRTDDVVLRERSHDKIVVDYPENISLTTGVPEDHIESRTARISKATKNAMQSGTDNTQKWIMQFDNRARWENMLIGWCSSADPLSNMLLEFNTKEEAIAFCKKNNWDWFVEKEKLVSFKKKSYAHNFSWNTRTRTSTK